jgi:hypothetical protein
MNPANHNIACGNDAHSGELPGSFEETLRMLANVPVPEGLADRVQVGLSAAPRQGRVLSWPAAFRPGGSMMRAAAVAGIVAVIAGGGYGVYSRVQPAAQSRTVAMPAHLAAPGGFSNAGAMRTPQTLDQPKAAAAAEAGKAVVKLPPSTPKKALHPGKAAVQRVQPLAK